MKWNSAIRTLEFLGYTYQGGDLWKPPTRNTLNFDLIDSLQKRLDAVKKDAARYRWLREDCGIVEYKSAFGSIGSGMLPCGDELDAAIDTAMQAKEQQ